MATSNNMTTFNDLSQKYSVWVIKYFSNSFDIPLFFVWYTDTDENSTDRLLTYKSGQIFATTSLTGFKTTLLSEINKLTVFENLNPWLENFKDTEAVEYCTYDLNSVTSNIENNNLDIATIEAFANFINLFGDFVNQDDRNNHLQVHADNQLIKETWDYYYNYIFWPRFNDKLKFEVSDRPSLSIDTNDLLRGLNNIIKIFDNNIKPPEKAIC
jgi:hypothetical protein